MLRVCARTWDMDDLLRVQLQLHECLCCAVDASIDEIGDSKDVYVAPDEVAETELITCERSESPPAVGVDGNSEDVLVCNTIQYNTALRT